MMGESRISDWYHQRALILAPLGRDAIVARMLLAEAGLEAEICLTSTALVDMLDREPGFVILAEEALLNTDMRVLQAWVAGQPAWSSLPFIVLTRRGGGLERNPVADRLSGILENVTFLERPFHPTTLVGSARSALRARTRQYEARARMLELHEGEARLRVALTAGKLGSWELRLPEMALTASNTCKALFGRSGDEPFGYADLLSTVHPDDIADVLAAIDHTIATGSDCRLACRLSWRDGSLHWAEIQARIVRGRGPARLVGVSSDITARMIAEQELRNLNETLEQRVEERTRQLSEANTVLEEAIRNRESAEEQLRQAQKMEIIGQLTGGVAHDFNNLLMAVMGNLDLLRKHAADDPHLRRLIDGAMQGAQRGAALTQRLLAFARRQELLIEPRDLSDLIEGAGELLHRSVGPEIDLHYDIDHGLPPAAVDANQLDLALLNLVVNARDAMPTGGRITISLRHFDIAAQEDLPAGSYLCLTVADEGTGMDAETLKKAIDPFFSTKELGKGTGLGLSMIHGLALQLKGALRLRSARGEGTRAELWLPATIMTCPVPPAPEEMPASATGPLRVLFVDDDALIAMGSVAMLEDLGHEVTEVYSGAKALELLKTGQPFDLMITDFSMPKMNGGQLAMACRDIRPDLPILLATGYAELPDGMELDLPRLAKPYMLQQLETEIFKVMTPFAKGDGSGGIS